MSDVCIVGSGAVQVLTALSDRAVVEEVGRRAAGERHATAALLRVLIEFDRRRLYLGEGYSSLFVYCTEALHYSEHAAFNRIEVARAAARWPQLLACIEDGSLHLAGARLLAPHLTEENIEQALADARHKSKREIEEVAAKLAQRAILIAVHPQQYRLYLTISREARDTLRQVQALIRHQVPSADPAVIFEQALALMLEKLQRQRFAETSRHRVPGRSQSAGVPAAVPGPSHGAGVPATVPGPSHRRHVPAAVRRKVWERDGAQCAFIGRQGRCSERTMLEFHHLIPYAAGGSATMENIELRCRPHNAYEVELYFNDGIAPAAHPEAEAVTDARVTPPTVDPGGELTRPGASSGPELEPINRSASSSRGPST